MFLQFTFWGNNAFYSIMELILSFCKCVLSFKAVPLIIKFICCLYHILNFHMYLGLSLDFLFCCTILFVYAHTGTKLLESQRIQSHTWQGLFPSNCFIIFTAILTASYFYTKFSAHQSGSVKNDCCNFSFWWLLS